MCPCFVWIQFIRLLVVYYHTPNMLVCCYRRCFSSSSCYAYYLFWFFGTEIGTALRATGVNPQMIRAQGVNTDNMIVLGLLISNGFVGMSGALIGQFQGFADVGMGIGTIVIGLGVCNHR